ncbi:hypothetical protein ABID22_000807 [Pontibacter aydingkolensis]|uniref:STAS/SEC14 domain-containing protein n=1 Tax=Pontibacter aydingkolensis TaxID=1911536 RepID=A0ABS7CR82_9BACT|nr:STAS/SEC14 domain-containing protein [Pontibacter aydingkolensis]MBW7466324.1 STAS/SEC14 domain-containing protein [Pontibacter aydingkolensis]
MEYTAKHQELKSSTGKVYLTITYDEKNRCVHNNWLGYLSLENVRQGAMAVLHFIDTFKAPHTLNDNRELVGPWDQAVDWIEQEWMPRAVEAGLKCFAHVVDQDAFAAAAATDMLNRVNGQFQMRIFKDIYDAKQWLGSCEK